MSDRSFPHLPWPAPALLAWAGAWALFGAARAAGLAAPLAATAAVLLGAGAAALVERPLRQLLTAIGFPLSALASGWAGEVPAWLWLLPMLLGLLAYPLRAWRDAPFFPTADGALDGLQKMLELPADARLLDAGCGLGDGLRALRQAWPAAKFEGIEWSLLLQLACRLRCRWATVRRGDMWGQSWARYDLVYLFQRPETMARALAKAKAEMAPGSWLVSLEFEAPGLRPQARLQRPGQRPVWAYRMAAKGNGRSTGGTDGR